MFIQTNVSKIIVLKNDKIYFLIYLHDNINIRLNALKADSWQLTLVQSDISPIDVASNLFLLSNVFLLHTRSRICDIQQERIKKKIKSFNNGYSD